MKSLVHIQFIYVHILTLQTQLYIAICNFVIATYLTKYLLHIHPNLIILHKMCIFYTNFVDYCGNFSPIMLALCSMLWPFYYAQIPQNICWHNRLKPTTLLWSHIVLNYKTKRRLENKLHITTYIFGNVARSCQNKAIVFM